MNNIKGGNICCANLIYLFESKASIKLEVQCPTASGYSATFNILYIHLTPRPQRPSWLLLNWTKNFFNAP